jgi:hypothetical protein
MALTTVDYNSYFNYKLSTKQITFTDKTDFVGQGTVAGNVTVVAKITAPVSGVIYNNTNHGAPDIDCGVSLDSIITIPLPLDAGGLPEQGLYTIQLTYQDLVVPTPDVVDIRTFTLDYTSPTVDISMTTDCITPLLAAVDDTAYTQNTIDPTITRAFAIHYPPSLQLADVTGTAATLTTSVFYTVAEQTVEHSSSLTSNLSYLFSVSDSMYVIDEVLGSEVIAVACDGDLCDIYCCIKSQYTRWQNAKGVNTVLANAELAKFEQITSIANLVGTALRCNKSSDVSAYVTQILAIAECDAGCSCSDGVPTLVTGLAITGDTIIVDAGTGITVTSVSGGGTTTYTVALSSTNVTKLSNLKNTEIVAGANTTAPKVTTTVGGVTTDTYTITATDTVVETVLARMLFTFAAGLVPVITITDQKEYGTTFGALTQVNPDEFIVNNFDSNYTDWSTNLTSFTVGNFFDAGAVDYWPEVQVVNVVKPEAGDEVSWSSNLTAQITSMGASSFEIRFSDEMGNPVNGKYLQLYTTLELIFKIQS